MSIPSSQTKTKTKKKKSHLVSLVKTTQGKDFSSSWIMFYRCVKKKSKFCPYTLAKYRYSMSRFASSNIMWTSFRLLKGLIRKTKSPAVHTCNYVKFLKCAELSLLHHKVDSCFLCTQMPGRTKQSPGITEGHSGVNGSTDFPNVKGVIVNNCSPVSPHRTTDVFLCFHW